MKIYLADSDFSQIWTPTRSVLPSILKGYYDYKGTAFDVIVKSDDSTKEELINNIKSSDIIIIIAENLTRSDAKLLYDNIGDKPLILTSYEPLGILYRKSTYKYFNDIGWHIMDVITDSKLINKISLTISVSDEGIIGIPDIYYPYYLSPSIFGDPYDYLVNSISSNIKIESDRLGCSAVYREGTTFRLMMLDRISDYVGHIDFGGKWNHNDDRVGSYQEFDIINYYKNFKYNLAVENTFFNKYITEKLVNPLLAGTVPIYYAPYYFPEDFINKEACIIITDKILYSSNDLSDLFHDRSGVPIFSDNALNHINNIRQQAFDKLDNL